ncbi:MAG: dTDP-4-dehydrorhamnose 3,5-epimerase [Gemmatimonadota bacterium]|nr:dTDP-4-dehydrorhamnose 3,5-epimerase [Gemmatimonadota bacterium]
MSFTFDPLEIPDVVLVRPTRHDDRRGWLRETYRRSAFAAAGIDVDFAQDNLVRSVRGVLRGMHFQLPPAAQGKLVGAAQGRIFDVAVDLRADRATYGEWVGRTVDAEDGALLWIPPGFAHGYMVLSETAHVTYKVTAEHRADLNRGFRWDDPDVGIEWPLADPILSDRDRDLPPLSELEFSFTETVTP